MARITRHQPGADQSPPPAAPRPAPGAKLKSYLSLTLAFVLALALIAILIADIAATTPASAPTFTLPGAGPAAEHTGPTPEPWFYDEANNQHWNPTPGHNHWHQGPPPPPEQRSNQP